MRSFVERIPDALDGQRIDRVVALIGDVSRRQAASLIDGGLVQLDAAVVQKASFRVAVGSLVSFEIEDEPDWLVGDPEIDLEVVHADDDVLVVNKQAGLIVHPGSGVVSSTLVHAVLARYPEVLGVGEAERPGIVHRLDKGTSGLLMVARTQLAYESLVAQLSERTVERRYRALVMGHLETDHGLIDAPLGRSLRDATQRAVIAGGRPARTHYEVISRSYARGDRSLAVTSIYCRLETGRTHQIRAHLSAIGHPVAGDPTYGGLAELDESGTLDRPFLHAERLGFEHPRSGERLTFSCPVAADLIAVEEALES